MLGWADIDTPQLDAVHRLFGESVVIKKAPKWARDLYTRTGREIKDWTGGVRVRTTQSVSLLCFKTLFFLCYDFFLLFFCNNGFVVEGH